MKPISSYFQKYTSATPLAVFRIGFGLLMFISIARFAAKDWINELYIQPQFFFSYYGFKWVQPLDEWTYLLFIICGLTSLFIAIGFKYRFSIILFFLSFTYIELMDKTTYLNHYYFISILSFLMIFLPAHTYFSVDAFRDRSLRSEQIPQWTIDAIKLLIGIVYFYAGLAKLNSDWLFHAMPLKIWLPAHYGFPFLGDLFQQNWVHFAFSWSGALYDLSIPFLLLMKRTRWIAFALVVLFHSLTRFLFPIGMFPYIMIVSALIFFEAGLHHKILSKISGWFNITKALFDNGQHYQFPKSWQRKTSLAVIGCLFILQVMIPFRYLLYPGELFWTEEGYRFSWRVMLTEKRGNATFNVVDPETGLSFYVDNNEFLTDFQQKQLSTQADFMLEYAHFLEDHYQQQGIDDPEIYVENYVSLNGRRSQPFIDPKVDLTTIEASLKHKNWILPFDGDIKGF